MNAEQLHDALTQLPDDLIAEADTLRLPKKKTILWKRLVPIAACFALVLGVLTIALPLLTNKGEPGEFWYSLDQSAAQEPESVMEPEAPAEAAPQEITGAPLAPDAEETLAPGEEESDNSGAIEAISVAAHTFVYDSAEPEGIQTEIISSLSELEESHLITEEISVEAYDEAWFRENQLILFLTDAASSSVCYDIRTIHKTAPGCWALVGTCFSPEWQTEDMVQQLILVELPRMVEPEDTVLLNITLVRE